MNRRLVWAFCAAIVAAGAAVPAFAADDIAEKVQVCAGCHGENGMSTDPKTIPIIWGQQESYIVKQLRNYRNGERQSSVMAPIAKSLEQGDLRKIAAYFAAKPWPGQIKQASASPMPKGISQCQPCHQPNFQGGMPAPRIAGLSYDYLITAMNAFAADKRTNNLDMPKFMRMLTLHQRQDIARYLSQL
jgi:cytochrome c553